MSQNVVNRTTREINTLDLIFTSLPSQFQLHKLSNHDVIAGTLKVNIPPIKKPRMKIGLYQKGDSEHMRNKVHSDLQKKKNSVVIQILYHSTIVFPGFSGCAHPINTSRSVSSVMWVTPKIRRKICTKTKTHSKVKKTGSSKFWAKIESLRRDITADVRKQYDLYVYNLVGDQNKKKETQGNPPLNKRSGSGVAQSELEKAEEFNGQFKDVCLYVCLFVWC